MHAALLLGPVSRVSLGGGGSPIPPTLGGEAEGPGMGSLEQGAES